VGLRVRCRPKATSTDGRRPCRRVWTAVESEAREIRAREGSMVILLGVDDTRVGRSFRAVRIRRRLRQQDVAESAGMSRSQVSLIERGHLDAMSLRALRQAARVLEITLDVNARWRGGELDRLVNGAHSLLAEDVAAYVATLPGWVVLPEVSYSIYGERGIVDLVAWHDATRTLLIIELKTLVVDVNELTGKVDAKRRLGAAIVASRGWQPARVGVWVVVAQDRTNERRVQTHHSLLRAAFPHNGHAVRHWLASPHGELSALSMWRARDESGAGRVPRQRVRTARRVGVAPGQS
jgi:transcriptional regulator with XRE-family HTH domain